MAGAKRRVRGATKHGSSRDHVTLSDAFEQLPQIEMISSNYIPAFKCSLCARCCTGKVIALFSADIRRLGGYAEGCTEPMSGEERTLTGAKRKMKMADGRCVFLENGRCKQYDMRPNTCRRHPFIVTKKYMLTAATCPGIDWTGRQQDSGLTRLSAEIAPKIDAYIDSLREERGRRQG